MYLKTFIDFWTYFKSYHIALFQAQQVGLDINLFERFFETIINFSCFYPTTF